MHSLIDLKLDDVKVALVNSGYSPKLVFDATFANEWSRGAAVYNLRFREIEAGLSWADQLLAFHPQCFIRELKGKLYADI